MPVIYAFSLAIVLLTGFATPVLAISAEDREIYRDAFAAIETGRYDKAQKIAENGGDRLPAKVIHWLVLRKGNKHPDFAALADFIADNPDWPALHELRRRAEEVVDSRVGDERVISWFEKFPPITGMGKLRFAEAQLRRGQTESGEKLLLEAWISGNFTRQQERAFLRNHRGRIQPDDHIARLDRVIWDQRRSEANRMLARVPQEYRYLGRARLMLMGRIGGVDNAIARVPAHLIDNPGLVYEQTRWRRRKGFDERARLLLDPLPEALVRPAAWWREARVQVRESLDVGEISLAYRLAANHRQLDRQYVAQAEWLAGWIALRFLEDPATAFQHFSTLFKACATQLASPERRIGAVGQPSRTATPPLLGNGSVARLRTRPPITVSSPQLKLHREKRWLCRRCRSPAKTMLSALRDWEFIRWCTHSPNWVKPTKLTNSSKSLH